MDFEVLTSIYFFAAMSTDFHLDSTQSSLIQLS